MLCLVKLAGTGTVRFVKRHNRNRQEYLLIPTLPHPFQQPNLCLASLTGEAGVSHSGLVQTARTPSAPFFPSLLTPPRLSLTGEGGFSPRRVPEQQDGLLTAVGKLRVGNYQTSYPSPASGCCCAPHRPRAHPSGAGTALWGSHSCVRLAHTPVCGAGTHTRAGLAPPCPQNPQCEWAPRLGLTQALPEQPHLHPGCARNWESKDGTQRGGTGAMGRGMSGGLAGPYLHLCRAKPGHWSPQVLQGWPRSGSPDAVSCKEQQSERRLRDGRDGNGHRG